MKLTRIMILTSALTTAALGPLPGVAAPTAQTAPAALPAGCSGTAPIRCHYDVAPGNYDVTVDLGSSTRAANTAMWVEARRQVLTAVSTNAGQVVRSTSTVNVRNPEGQPTGQGGTGTSGLSITFDGTAPAIGSLTVKPAVSPLVVYLAGDSTVCDQPTAPYTGWGQRLPTSIRNGAVVANYADSGESSGSFLANSALFPKLKPLIKSKDLVLIQFGHNDKDTTATTFRDNLTKMVNGVRERGGSPVLVTPPVRRLFSGTKLTSTALHVNSRGVDLPAVIRALGKAANVPVIDLTAKTKTLVESLGPTASQQLYLTREAGDNTHFSVNGATQIAGLVVQSVRELNLSLVGYLRPNALATAPAVTAQPAKPQLEKLNRGVINVHTAKGNRVSWRLLADDPAGVAFNVYRDGVLLTKTPVTGPTSYQDAAGAADAKYAVRAVVGGVERQAKSAGDDSLTLNSVAGATASSRDVPLQIPAGGTTPSGESYTYTANDTSVGDLDGDGEYEIVVKWDPTNAHDNSQAGYTGNVYLDAYKLNGTRLWRIDLGRNIRAGAHYTQFQVYDYDGDGRAEVAVKTGDGTKSGTGQVIGNASADHRNSSGYILSGPEFLSVFRGTDGAVLATANYQPPRGTVSAWGDSYGNRVDRFLAATAYLDGSRPSIIMARGYYTRSVITAWDFRNGALTQRWIFDSNTAGSQWTGKGNHNLSIADVDSDGRDEVLYGSMAIDDNGKGLWQNNTHHGDAYHVGDFIPSRPGLEVFKPSETTSEVAHWMGDARTGQILWSAPSCGCDNGRAVAEDIWAGNPGAEAWSAAVGGLRSATNGSQVAARKPGSTNFVIWWDGDAQRELLDGTHIDKYGTGGDTRLLTGSDVVANNGTKSTPALSADLFGDWREEVIWRTSDNRALRIYSTTDSTSISHPSLMQDRQYRLAVAWQNTGYNQPPHPSFAMGR
ncbi:rhamnogalacturonan lyase family protein [Kribbella monticola]|uniref:rhamnogalacturonan lyase family protein n=1 Tax=Kribbella monticola TaxID=2185285 RepID=UPI001E2D2393|nr:SGNH/GDSL hydrolase family protein [Kribbella monticola]